MFTPVNPNFTIQKCDVRGSTLHGHVCMICSNSGNSKLFGPETKYHYDSFINIANVANATIYSQRHAV